MDRIVATARRSPPFTYRGFDVIATPDTLQRKPHFSRLRSVQLAPIYVGFVGFLVSFAASWVPSLWRDEAATAYVANHTTSELFTIVGQIDAVFGLYYWLMHEWLSVVGTNPLTLRFLSAVAVGVGAAAVTATGTRLYRTSFGIVAGLLFAILPRMTTMGIEARSYALCAAMAAVLGWLTVVLSDRARALTAVFYFLVGTFAVYLHMYAVLVVGTLWLSGMFLARTKKSRIWLSFASAGVFAATIPLLLLAKNQAGAQISWINSSPLRMMYQAVVEQYFPYKTVVRFTTPDQEWVRVVATVLAVVAWLLIAVVVVRGWKQYRRLLIFSLPSVVLPTTLVLAYSLAVSPVYTPKYLIATVPAFAILLACALFSLRRTWVQATAVVLLVGLIVPIYIAQRQPNAKFVIDDYSFIAETVDHNAREGDGILFDSSPGDPIESGRNAISGYPQAFSKTLDMAEVTGPARLTTPWSPQLSFNQIHQVVEQTPRIWLVTTPQRDNNANADYAAELTQLGFREVSRFAGPTHIVLLWSR
ncbi:glycosyltransferase family 39 protein [Arthrobacter alpinus]|nr:glycosyltransferase family 39 protein [Arthrobacter alpinus]